MRAQIIAAARSRETACVRDDAFAQLWAAKVCSSQGL
jgi:hypothetical protein